MTTDLAHKVMCPHCGHLFTNTSLTRLIPFHASLDGPGDLPYSIPCPGSEQVPRCPESDRRPLWNGAPNPHFCG